ncbi:hypothetical protein J4458_07135 [Candidatus Woesearchaeota archaeon]|nr:hypothetical protein [Candidatus Woesearchaeota archaeon]
MVGNLKNYTKIDILRCLLRIEKPVSRAELSRILDLGEGTVRSILDILKENNFLESNKNGHYLSPKGDNFVQKIKNNIVLKNIDLDSIFPEQKKIAVQIKSPKNIEKSYILRDVAVKNGAEGAIILKYDKSSNKLRIFDAEHEENFDEIGSKFNLSGKDLLIIAYADSYKLAEHGALAVAVELDDDLRNLMDKF